MIVHENDRDESYRNMVVYESYTIVYEPYRNTVVNESYRNMVLYESYM